MDWTPLIHAAIAAIAQVACGLALGNWWLGAALACVWWLAREHTQAEYRWIAAYADGKRAGMPWWGGLDPRAWDWPSVLDAAVPIAMCTAIYIAARWAVF